jgi:hypothetical protein
MKEYKKCSAIFLPHICHLIICSYVSLRKLAQVVALLTYILQVASLNVVLDTTYSHLIFCAVFCSSSWEMP